MEAHRDPPAALFLYRESALRRAALAEPAGSAERYSLYGLDELEARGWKVRHNLEPGAAPGAGARIAGRALDRTVRLAGGYSGDFPAVLAVRGLLRRTDVVFSTVDTVGIPLVLLARLGLVHTPVVYAAIGLPERLEQLGERTLRAYCDAYRRLHTIVAYGAGEVDALRSWLGARGPRVVFVPFGVDTDSFRPDPTSTPVCDVVSVGSDPRRDFALLLETARRRPEWSLRVVGSTDNVRDLAPAPPGVVLDVDVPFSQMREALARARVVALPVRENSYSGATTVLLQSMALGKPVVVSRTAAIAEGYQLEDGVNCVLVPPGDGEALERAIAGLLADPERAASLGTRARETVERHLTWERYAERIGELLAAAAGRTTVAR